MSVTSGVGCFLYAKLGLFPKEIRLAPFVGSFRMQWEMLAPSRLIYNHGVSRKELNEAFSNEF
jgi:hypothetical protein